MAENLLLLLNEHVLFVVVWFIFLLFCMLMEKMGLSV